MSIGFSIVHGSVVVIRHKYVHKQTQAYHRDKQLYAKASGGYVRMSRSGSTTHPDITWLEASISDEILKPGARMAGFLEYTKNDAG